MNDFVLSNIDTTRSHFLGERGVYIVVSSDPIIGQDLVETILEFSPIAKVSLYTGIQQAAVGIADAESVRGIFVTVDSDDLDNTDIFVMLDGYGAFIVLMNDLPAELLAPVKPERILSISFPFTSEAVHDALRQIAVHRP